MSSSESGEWSDNFLGDDAYLKDGETATGINVTYDEATDSYEVHEINQ